MKNNVKKYLTMGLSLVLVAAVSILGTIAYLTDTDSKLNTFTVGNIDIALKEDVGVIGEGATVTETADGAVYTGAMPGDYLKKEVTVTNDGNNAAYVAVTVTLNNALKINKAIDAFYEAKGYTEDEIQAVYNNVFVGFGMNYKKVDKNGNALGMRLTIEGDDMPKNVIKVDAVKTISEYWQQAANNWFKDTDTIVPYDGYYTTGMNDYELRYTYYMLLEKGESTTLFKGVNVPEVFNKDQLAMFDGLKIDVKAAAIQADNFNGDAKAAFTALKTELADGVNDGDAGSFATTVSSADAMYAALDAGEKDLVVIGATIDKNNLNGHYYKDRNIDFIDCTFTANMNYMYINNATYTNCTFDCGAANSAVHYDELFGDLVFNNCTFKSGKIQIGANKEMTGTVTFNDCKFAETTSTSIWSEKGIRVYSPAEFNDCEFNNRVIMAGVNGLSITFNSCTTYGNPVAYIDGQGEGSIIRGGNVPVVTINN